MACIEQLSDLLSLRSDGRLSSGNSRVFGRRPPPSLAAVVILRLSVIAPLLSRAHPTQLTPTNRFSTFSPAHFSDPGDVTPSVVVHIVSSALEPRIRLTRIA